MLLVHEMQLVPAGLLVKDGVDHEPHQYPAGEKGDRLIRSGERLALTDRAAETGA